MDRLAEQPMRKALPVVIALQIVVGIIAALIVSPAKAVAVAPPPPPPAAKPQLLTDEPAPAPSVAPGESIALDPVGATVPLFKELGGTQPFKTLTNPTWEKVPLVLHMLEDRGDWVSARVNIRPNGTTAWVRRSDVTMRRVANRIIIELSARRLTVLHGNDVLAQHQVGVGTPRTPTPVGEFYVDATVHLKGHPTYGAGQLSVSGFSDVLHSFGGGIGQIAIHGWNSSGAMGNAVSNGCIRMVNDAWKQVASLAPNGTPVSIRA